MTSSKNPFLDGEALIALIREQTAMGQTVRNVPFRGVSMLPMLRQGKDSVDFSPLPERLKKYDLPVYQLDCGKVIMHRVVADKGDYYICNADNQAPLEKIYPHQMIALVTAFTRKGKRIEVTSKGYRAYCVFWHYTRPLRRPIVWIRDRIIQCAVRIRSIFVKQ